MAERIPTTRHSVGGKSKNPTRREALAKLGLISATTLLAADIVTLSSNMAHAQSSSGSSKSAPCKKDCNERSRSRTRLKGPSKITETFCDSPDTDTSGFLYSILCTG